MKIGAIFLELQRVVGTLKWKNPYFSNNDPTDLECLFVFLFNNDMATKWNLQVWWKHHKIEPLVLLIRVISFDCDQNYLNLQCIKELNIRTFVTARLIIAQCWRRLRRIYWWWYTGKLWIFLVILVSIGIK